MTDPRIATLIDEEIARNALFAMIIATDPTTLNFNDDDIDDESLMPTIIALTPAFTAILADRPLLTELCESLDICPIHLCDLEICIDDNAPCTDNFLNTLNAIDLLIPADSHFRDADDDTIENDINALTADYLANYSHLPLSLETIELIIDDQTR